ncbi:MAG: hypothetical protein NC411_00360 [Bacteroides sp.]|nr:hypothetical protein [Bacteroides sp.]
MNKNSTPEPPVIAPTFTGTSQGPARLTLEKIRQFARAYSFVPMEISALGSIIAN